MLSFEEKLAIADSFPELERRNVSMGRVNYHFEGSLYEKKTVVYRLHPNGGGYVYAGRLREYDGVADEKGMLGIRDFTAEQFREVIAKAIASLADASGLAEPAAKADQPAKPSKEERWINEQKQTLELKLEDEDIGGMWYVYSGLNLDAVFETYREAAEYLKEEGFARA
ncbi:hypothetical protein [Cohnella sp. AR92]|uniref:hypothetical protein n=1 Tax=Cohnella sp. AR92 TaxID=648716 RepID=UPI000F8ECCD6|nr:hypothetical protein [Cohnella sp. AR92]RUS42824.1 hypothetical protein ELR57_25800 [Cohnella sp. AR92]